MELSDFASVFWSSKNGRDAAQRTLQWLQEQYAARSVAVWRADGDRFLLELSICFDHLSQDGTTQLWAEHKEALLQGRLATDSGRVLVPIRPGGAYVYLDGIDTRRLNASLVAECGAVVIQALRQGEIPAARLRPTTRSGVFREELIATLRLHEWNLARVARVKGVSRKTIYDWLAKFQIDRETVRKS